MIFLRADFRPEFGSTDRAPGEITQYIRADHDQRQPDHPDKAKIVTHCHHLVTGKQNQRDEIDINEFVTINLPGPGQCRSRGLDLGTRFRLGSKPRFYQRSA